MYEIGSEGVKERKELKKRVGEREKWEKGKKGKRRK
jgi:hypothetical protein